MMPTAKTSVVPVTLPFSDQDILLRGHILYAIQKSLAEYDVFMPEVISITRSRGSFSNCPLLSSFVTFQRPSGEVLGKILWLKQPKRLLIQHVQNPVLYIFEFDAYGKVVSEKCKTGSAHACVRN